MLKDFVTETSNAPGTSSTVTLAGAVTGRVSFAQAFSTGDTPFYFMDDGSQAEWGIGTLTTGSPNTLARTTVIGNTAGNTSRLNFAGTVYVYNELPAENTLYIDATATAKAPNAFFDPFSGGVPIGAGIDFWGTTAPSGWLFPYGQDVSRTTYAKFWAAMGSPNTGDGSTTFTMPDKRGRVSVALDNLGGAAANRVTSAVSGFAANTLGAVGGDQHAQADTLTATSTATSTATNTTHETAHSHTMFTETGSTGTYGSGAGTQEFVCTTIESDLAGPKGTDAATTGITVSTTVATTVATTVTSALTGASQNMQPGIACNYIIFVGA